METYIAREDDYRNEIRKHFNSILNGRLLSFNLKQASDEDVSKFPIDFDGNLSYEDNCCTWLEIGEIGKDEFIRPYYFIELKGSNDCLVSINLSQFKYGMSPLNDGFPSYEEDKAIHVCTVDGNQINPETFFSEHKGKNLLYLYSYPVVNKFNSVKRCFQFAYKQIYPSSLRNYIYNAQVMLLKNILDNPSRDIPGTTLRIEFGNSQHIYEHNVTCKETNDFALEIFNQEFKELFINKLSDFEELRSNQ